MKKIVSVFLLILLFFFFFKTWIPARFLTSTLAYMQIGDIRHPTADDYHRLQQFLARGIRPSLEKLGDCKKKVRRLDIFGGTPESDIIHVNCEESENCIITYASFNKNFSGGCRRLIEKIRRSGFQGDILYQIGGWPNVEEGDLVLAHVPYAFKVCLFRETKRRGYKRVLWLDTSIIPVADLNTIFSRIEEKGYFAMGNSHTVGPYFNASAARALNISLEESFQIPSCSAGLIGLDLTSEKGGQVLEKWYQAACDGNAFFSPRSDQNALSIILYQLGMRDWAPIEQLAHGQEEITPQTLFLIDRGFVHK